MVMFILRAPATAHSLGARHHAPRVHVHGLPEFPGTPILTGGETEAQRRGVVGSGNERTRTRTRSAWRRSFCGVVTPFCLLHASSLRVQPRSIPGWRPDVSEEDTVTGGPEERAGADWCSRRSWCSPGTGDPALRLPREEQGRPGSVVASAHGSPSTGLQGAVLWSSPNQHSAWPERDTSGASSDSQSVQNTSYFSGQLCTSPAPSGFEFKATLLQPEIAGSRDSAE